LDNVHNLLQPQSFATVALEYDVSIDIICFLFNTSLANVTCGLIFKDPLFSMHK